jgi:hypothetical protein
MINALALAGLVFPRNDPTRPPKGCRCHCGAFLQWGEETSETAADYYAGQANPDRAFDE